MLKPKIILAIETSTSACSVALKIDETIDQVYEEGNNLHSKRLLAMVDQLLHRHEISLDQVELIVAGVGPGAFTGLRIGVGVAQGLAYSHAIPVMGASSLQTLAQSVSIKPGEYVISGLDARMSEIYWTIFCKETNGSLTEVFESHQLNSPMQIELLNTFVKPSTILVGNAWSIYFESFLEKTQCVVEKNQIVDTLPQAQYSIEYALSSHTVSNWKECFDLSPLYVRNDIAKKATVNPLLKIVGIVKKVSKRP